MSEDKTGKIYAKMAKVLAEFPVVGKGQKNPSQGYNYRGIDDALAALNPLFSKHGVFILIRDLNTEFSGAGKTAKGKDQVRALTTGTVRFQADDGSFVDASLVGEGVDTGDKACMKSLANGLKYVLWYTFAVPTYGEKKDSEAFEDPEPTQAAPKKKTTRKHKPTQPVAESIEVASFLREIEDADTADALQEIASRISGFLGDVPKTNPDRKALTDAWVAKQKSLPNPLQNGTPR